MYEFIRSMTPVPWWNARQHFLPVASCITLIMAFYIASLFVEPGWTTWAASTISLVLLVLTAWARLNDISIDKMELHWQLRRIGLVMVVGGCLGVMFEPWIHLDGHSRPEFPTWREVMMRLGIIVTWMTTPFMPPWYRYISGEHRNLVVEVPDDVMVDVVRVPTDETGGMYTGSGPGPEKEEDK